MLEIVVVVEPEKWNDERQEFILPVTKKLQLEHSLVSLRKWESKWQKPFLSKTAKTDEEALDYVKCMTITQHVDPDIYRLLSEENYRQINEYIEAPMTATTFSADKNGKSNREIITAELIYYWMIALNIPVKFEKWHLNSLLTLIRVCNIKNAPPKKTSKTELMRHNAALNAARRQKYNSRG